MSVRALALVIGLAAAVPASGQAAAAVGATPSVPTPGAAAKTAKTAAPQKMVCKRVPVIGSNVATERVCVPREEWQKVSDEARSMWEELQGRKGSTSGN